MIKSAEQFENWLADKPPESAHIMAVRTALRVLPLVLPEPDVADERHQKPLDDLLLQTFRANFISWAAGKYPAHDMRFAADAAAAYAAAARAGSAAARAAVAAAGAAARAAARTGSAAARTTARAGSAAARTTAQTAAYAAARAADAAARTAAAADAADTADAAAVAYTQIWIALSADARWLQIGPDEPALQGDLIDQPLWLWEVNGAEDSTGPVPHWARRRLEAFRTSDLARTTSFGLIGDWYRALLPDGAKVHSLFGQQADFAIATQPDDFWIVTKQRSARQIMDEVAAIAGWPRATVPEDGDDPDSQPIAPYNFVCLDYQFALTAPSANLTVSPGYRDDMWNALVSRLGKALDGSVQTNAVIPTSLEEILSDLRSALGSGPEDVRPGVLQSHWRLMARPMKRLSEEGGTGSTSLDDALDAVADALEDLRGCYRDIRDQEKEMIRLGVTSRTVDQIIPLLRQFAEALETVDSAVLPQEIKDALGHNLALIDDTDDKDVQSDIVADQVLTEQAFGVVLRRAIKDFFRDAGEVARKDMVQWTGKLPRRITQTILAFLGLNYLGLIEPLSELVPKLEPLYEKFRALKQEGLLDQPDDDDDKMIEV